MAAVAAKPMRIRISFSCGAFSVELAAPFSLEQVWHDLGYGRSVGHLAEQ